MRAKTRYILLAVSLAALAAMFALARLSEQEGYSNMLLITARGISLGGQSLEKVEEVCEDEFLLTYEIPENATVRAVNSSYKATLVGTNSAYPEVMNYSLRNGGFFTKSAWDSKSKHAVLNENAAYTIFGSVNISSATVQINGDTWIVAGVIRDNDEENLNIYVPSSVAGGNTRSLMAMTDDSGAGEAYVINELKDLGVHESDSDYMNLSKAARAFSGRFWVSLKAAWCLAVAFFVKRGASWLAKRISSYKNRLRHIYPRELVAEYRAELLKMSVVAVVLLAGVGTALYFSLQILEECLAWREWSLPDRYMSGDFANKLAWLYDYQLIGIGLFAVFILAIAGIFILSWKGSPDLPGEKKKL